MDGFTVTDILSSQLYEIVTLCFNIAGSRASHAQPFSCPELAGSGKLPCLWRNLSFDSVIAWLGTFSHVTTYLFMHRKLDNYLRTHRKRAGLSQDEEEGKVMGNYAAWGGVIEDSVRMIRCARSARGRL
jgi:hypothetical protein